MSRRRPNRSLKLEDEVDVEYTIEMPFNDRDAKILLIERGDEGIEVIVGNIPTPSRHDTDRNYPSVLEDEETMRTHAAAQWIITETTQMFSDYDWKTSDYKSNNPNYHLRDIYFNCEPSEVDDAVLTAKKFIAELEEKSIKHTKEFGTLRNSPSKELSS